MLCTLGLFKSRGALFGNFLEFALLNVCWTLPSISRVTPGLRENAK